MTHSPEPRQLVLTQPLNRPPPPERRGRYIDALRETESAQNSTFSNTKLKAHIPHRRPPSCPPRFHIARHTRAQTLLACACRVHVLRMCPVRLHYLTGGAALLFMRPDRAGVRAPEQHGQTTDYQKSCSGRPLRHQRADQRTWGPEY